MRGIDLSERQRTELKQELGLYKFRNLYGLLETIFQTRINLEAEAEVKLLSEAEIKLMTSYCREQHDNDLADVNWLFHACKNLPGITQRVLEAGGDNPALQYYLGIVDQAKAALQKYLRRRDEHWFKIVKEELDRSKVVLLNIGNLHLDREWAGLPQLVEESGVAHHSFSNVQSHTNEEQEEHQRFLRK